MKEFNEWKKSFDNQNMYDFNTDISGIAWLKLKSIMRTAILKEFLSENNIILATKGLAENFKELYALYYQKKLKFETIDNFLIKYNQKEISNLNHIFDEIEAELYKLHEFSWGGDSTNSLDKQIISYVKEISCYDEIIKKIDNDICINTKKYTLNSWYNNWTSILTEHIFKSHLNVVSAIGKIKSVDFFIQNIPLDLKITYFPKEFLKKSRKDNNLTSELTFLKTIAKENSIHFDKNDTEDVIKYQITEQIKDINNPYLNQKLEDLHQQNKQIIKDTMNNKNVLIHWLYEKQGEMRFGSENRLFIVLVDTNDFNNAWKLKRNFKLLKRKINDYLNNFNRDFFLTNKIEFSFLGKNYEALADIIFISI